MKYITLIIGLLVVGCGKQEKAVTNESTPTTNTNEVDGATENPTQTVGVTPVKELTLEEKVIGTYERKDDEDTYRGVLLESGVFENYRKGKKLEEDYKWSISKDGELHIADKDGIVVFRINKDGSLTAIASIDKDGERKDVPKEKQTTIKKIK